MPTATQLASLVVLYGMSADYMLFGFRTIPTALLDTEEGEQCTRLHKLMEGFRGLVQAWVRS